MQTEILFVIEPAAEGGWVGQAHGHSIHVQADTVEGLRAQVRDAVECHFDAADRPRLVRLHFVHDELITV
jgi:predicted RNase H-like HicB family nuclease